MLNLRHLKSAVSVALLSTAIFAVNGCFRQVIRDIEVRVPQLRSPECARLIQEALSHVDGVISATPDLSNKIMVVRYNSEKLGTKNVEYVIAGTGFDANDIPHNPEARAKLPAGCQ
jgi:copper chaperone CopZ